MSPADQPMRPGVGAEATRARNVQPPMASSRAGILVRQALDLIDAPSAALDPLGQIIEVNLAWDATARLGGAAALTTGAGVSYLAICDMAAGEDTDGAAESAAGIRSVLSGAAPRFDLDYPCADRWYSLRVTTLGGFGGVIVTHLDITSLKEAELRLQQEERRLHLPFDESMPIFALIGEDGVVRRRSPTTSRLLGLEVDVVLGETAFDRIDPADRERAAIALSAVASTPGATERVELTVIDGEGRRRQLDVVAANLLHDPDVAAIVVTGSDVTEGRRAQISRRLESRLMNVLPTSVVVTDERRAVVYWNDRATAIFGLTADQALGRTVAELRIGALDDERSDEIRAAVLLRGRWHGEYDARRSDGSVVPVHSIVERLDDEDIGFHGIVAATVDISDRRRLESEVAYQALHDPLTGLPNRSMVLDHLDGALTRAALRGGITTVLCLDLDDFGSINELVGHVEGDEVLRAVAALLGSVVYAGNMLAHLGGDAFVVCCEDLVDASAVYVVAEKVLQVLKAPFRLGGELRTLTASMGVATSVSSRNGDALLRNAESALRVAKGAGRGRVELFDDVAHQRARQRHEIAGQLEQAITEGELATWFQPEVDIVTGALFGFEALVRWPHPVRGLMAPDEFIAIAEENDLIGALGSLVLTDACKALGRWLELVPDHPLTVSVNVSAHQLADSGLASSVEQTIDRCGVPADRICLEVTESALMDTPAAASALRALQATGVKIAIDDFGTGYSSLRRLKRFPVDFLKIDREFIAGLGTDDEDDVIVSAVVNLGRSLGLRLIAEGIETTEQLAALDELGCEYGQGYLWSRPLPEAEATAFVHADHRRRIETAGG